MPPRRRRPASPDSPFEAPEPEIDFSQFTKEQLDLLGQVHPHLKKQIELLRSLQAKAMLIEAGSALGRSALSPEKFATSVLGWRATEAARIHGYNSPLTPQQSLLCRDVVENSHVAVPSGHGVGKTKWASLIVLWWVCTVKDSVAITTATTWAQVEAQLWREIRSGYASSRIPLPGRILQTELQIGEKWFARGISTDEPTAFRGFHSYRVLVLFDEANGVLDELWDEAESMILSTRDRFVAIGNPTEIGTRFHRACLSGRWKVRRLDAREHPNVIHDDPNIIPGAIAKQFVNDRLEEYGSEDSPLFASRVAGHFPTQGEFALINTAWIEKAQRWELDKAKRALVDEIEQTEARIAGAPDADDDDDASLILGSD